MSTQHPDNVASPFFASSPLMDAGDEIREAFYAFSHLGCEEQMWDFEGKEVDAFVVEKLLSAHADFFRSHALGERVFLTPRVPNPRLEPAQAKVLLEILHSLPRHSDAARLFYGYGSVPIFELIYPMTVAASELERIRRYYDQFVAGLEGVRILPDDEPLGSHFGPFLPRDIELIPLLEEKPYLLGAGALVRDHLRAARPTHARVFIARSDPALNYGFTAAVLLAMTALDQLADVERSEGVPILPILGVGSAPFRGGLRPGAVGDCVRTYPSVQTFTAQSAFKYDHAPEAVVAAIAELKALPRSAPLALADDPRVLRVLETAAQRYRAEVATLAPLVATVARHVPRRRMRKLHIGLFGYSRGSGPVRLPRAITFCASLYSIGLPPELLGLAALSGEDWRVLDEVGASVSRDVREALRYLDPAVMKILSPLVQESVEAARKRYEVAEARCAEHLDLVKRLRSHLTEGRDVGDLVLRAGSHRGFLG
jgi:phosphoenolpyruvate carboxylase